MIKFLLSDKESLEHYSQGKFVSLDDVKRRLLLAARNDNRAIPDHFYRLSERQTFQQIDSMSTIFTIGLVDLSCEQLEMEGKRVYVQLNKHNNWQELLTYIPPLLMQSAILYKFCPDYNSEDLITYYNNYIFPNTRHTAIPSPRIPQLDYLMAQENGLHDLHMHLNGALETDFVWQDFLFNPRQVHNYLQKGSRNPKVKEQIEQESSLLEPMKFYRLLNAARKLRTLFYSYLVNGHISKEKDKYALLFDLSDDTAVVQNTYKHPFTELISNNSDYRYLTSVEGLMYCLLLRSLSRQPNELVANLFHFYLLILGLTNRLLVQQTHQKGFEQFQKLTLNELREGSEKTFLRRYHQMQGNDFRFIRFLEGRFSPKDNEKENIRLLNAIGKGWDKMKRDITFENKQLEIISEPELKLIAHFIKKEDQAKNYRVRHNELRNDIWKRGRVLALLLKNNPHFRQIIRGVDAAASEFDASPEVFAPVFRLMRRSGIKHFTYHAGEDFHHILDGMRAVYEAILFCDLRKGDRIGHATALGLSPHHWGKMIGNEMLVRKGEYLDSLIFSYHVIVKYKLESLQRVLPFLLNHVNNISFQIYNEHYTIAVLEQAWLMRQCCPIHTIEDNKGQVDYKLIYDESEWLFPEEKHFLTIREEKGNKARELFTKYHNSEFRNGYDEIISIHPFEILSSQDIELLQLQVLSEMTKQEIVIETLPTSNVRIGFHKNFSTYHLKNWITWREQGKSIPPIVIGSDDTGIFATNIYNEYANVYCVLINEHNMPQSKVMDVIKKINEDSHVYRFD